MRPSSGWILLAAFAAASCEARGPETGEAAASSGERPAVAEETALARPFELTGSQEAGRTIWETTCWTCHGADGRADGPVAGDTLAPPNFHEHEVGRLSAEQLTARFDEAFAREDSTLPHMRLVASLLGPERFRDALSWVPALVWPAEIPGSAWAGRALYENRCQACHGPEGAGDGPAAESLLVSPADLTRDTLVAAGDWDAVFRRIEEGHGIHGSAMPSWGLVLSEGEMWDLVAYVASLQPGVLEPPAEAGP